MPKTPKLSDLQRILLSTASTRADGSLFPLPKSLKADDARLPKAIQALVAKKLAAEIEVTKPSLIWHEEDGRRIGLTITKAGQQAIAVEPEGAQTPPGAVAPDTPPASDPKPQRSLQVRPGTKQAQLVEMIEREAGATIQEIVDVTGWLPHTTRAALTGLRKRGWEIAATKENGVSRYRGKKAAA